MPKRTPKRAHHPLRTALLMCGLCLLALALRVTLLEAQPIWWDEAISIHLATSSVSEMLSDRAANIHPPLYFLLLKAWITAAGTSAFSTRFFSCWFNTLLVPAAYAFGRRWFDRRTGILAALLAALSSLNIIYSQEVRVYAVLPLAYLVLLSLSKRLARAKRPAPWRAWLLFAATEAAGLYLHYTFIFAAAYANLLLIPHLRKDRRSQRRWLTSLALVALLCLPWLIAVLLNWEAGIGSRVGDLSGDDPFAELVPLDYLVRLLWDFQWSGLSSASAYAPVALTSAAIALLMAIGFAALARAPQAFRTTLGLLLTWALPLAVASLVWVTRPRSHPRYVLVFAASLLVTCAYLVSRLSRGNLLKKALATLVAVSILLASAISTWAYFVDPRFAKDDTRGVAQSLTEQAAQGDLILVPPQDYSIPYYYTGPATLDMIPPGDSPSDWNDLSALTASDQRVYLVDYYRATFDPRDLFPFAFESHGSLIDRRDHKGLYVRTYQLSRQVEAPELTPSQAQFGPLRLSGSWVEDAPSSDTAVTAALRWVLDQPTDTRHRVVLRLRDSSGWEWARADDWILGQGDQPTDRWQVGQEATTYHIIPLPPGAPPISYTLAAGVFWLDQETVHPIDLLDPAGNPQGQSFSLGTTQLQTPLGISTDPYHTADLLPPGDLATEFPGGLLLAGASVDRQTAAPGERLFVTLWWELDGEPTPGLQAELALEQAGATLAVETGVVGGRYPIDRWPARATIVEHRSIAAPATADDGSATISLQVDGQRIVLGQVEIDAAQHTFTPPPMEHQLGVRFGDVAELVGYDLPLTEVVDGEPVPITLYWRALDGARNADYVVFAHILAFDGHLVGQHDSPPANGSRPTTGWIANEIITDEHLMGFREPYTGLGRIEIGLYDPVTMDRVLTQAGESFILVPQELSVIPAD